MGPKILLFFCFIVTLSPAYSELKSSSDEDRARLPEYLAQLDLASVDASVEDIEAIKNIVKRLAPEPNGEYQVYQGVMGQPGVDFPALTTIPTTTFSCRGKKGGYYADLETNCQVFHICDNGRKISFLCPNGTIFQQSQLICDWWFKVDCSKSTELYEQSAEQLAEDERKRLDAKRINSEFHRPSADAAAGVESGPNYFQTSNYDGRQNGRTNPYGQTSGKNQAPGNSVQRGQSPDYKPSTRAFDPNQIYSGNSVTPSSYNQINDLAAQNTLRNNKDNDNNNRNRQQGQRLTTDRGNYRAFERTQNQLVEATNEEKRRLNYESRSEKYTQNNFGGQRSSLTTGSTTTRDNERRNFAKSTITTSFEHSSNRATPSYTETTTFRTSTTPSPVREFQQVAESAAFASNRGRFGEARSSSQFNAYFNNFGDNVNGSKPTRRPEEKPRQRTTQPTPDRTNFRGNVPFPTFQPIYKPRTSTDRGDFETTTLAGTTTSDDRFPTTQRYNENPSRTTYENFESRTTPYPSQESTTETFTEDYSRNSVTGNAETFVTSDFFENTTPTIISSGTYLNAKEYGRLSAGTNSGSGFTTSRPKSQEYRQSSVVTTNPVSQTTLRRSDASHVTASPIMNDQSHRDASRSSVKNFSSSRQNLISSTTEKPRAALNPQGFTGKTLSPYDTSFTYQQGKVMSTLGPYVPFTKNYAYSTPTTSTTPKPPVYTATVPPYSSTTIYRSSSPGKNSPRPYNNNNENNNKNNNNNNNNDRSKSSSFVSSARPLGGLPSGSAAYLPEKKKTQQSPVNSDEERANKEFEHAMSMLASLRDLEGTAPSVFGSNSTRSGLEIPSSSGPSTLHSLALYFATASDELDATIETKTSSAEESGEESEEAPSKSSRLSDEASVELPKSILTQRTINSYADLFELNNALEGIFGGPWNASTENSNEDSEDDLDIEQSQGPIDGAKKSDSARLRELAQVFTHALSAYLQDPETFKKVLTEIRPTEPTTGERLETTTSLAPPTTLEDYPSVTKEKDEVLDFSDDSAPHRHRPTTIYPVTDQPPTMTQTYTQDYTTSANFFTTTGGGEPDENFAFQVNHAFGTTNNGNNEITSGTGDGLYYPEVLSGPSETTAFEAPSSSDSRAYDGDNYFPSDEANKLGGFQNNSGTPSAYEPYGKNVQPFDATPINDNYVSSSTPATFQFETSDVPTRSGDVVARYGRIPDNPADSQPSVTVLGRSENLVASGNEKRRDGTNRSEKRVKSTTEPFRIRYYDTTTFPPPDSVNRESLATAGTAYSKYRETGNDFASITEKNYLGTSIEPFTIKYLPDDNNNPGTSTTFSDEATTTFDETNRQNERELNDHWTSSPAVTQLWESTVFVDPKRINQGLASGPDYEYSTTDYSGTTESTTNFNTNNKNSTDKNKKRINSDNNSSKNKITNSYNDRTTKSNDRKDDDNNSNKNNIGGESLVSDATSSGVSYRKTNKVDYPSSPWKWSGVSQSEKDGPTTLRLLPQAAYSRDIEQPAASPAPVYTTRSSITTTITSSVTTTTSADEGISRAGQSLQKLRPKHGIISEEEEEENEIEKAHEMFGGLNSSSTNTLMRVMKQADNNATVRQLVLLLINHCNGPMNKTMQQEKEQLLDALLRMPVNEFTTEESRDIVAGINRLNLPIGKGTDHLTSGTTQEPVVTTFRSKKEQRFKNDKINSRSGGTRKNDDIATAESSSDKNNPDSSSEDTSASDARALELLRSLYTIAAKWG